MPRCSSPGTVSGSSRSTSARRMIPPSAPPWQPTCAASAPSSLACVPASLPSRSIGRRCACLPCANRTTLFTIWDRIAVHACYGVPVPEWGVPAVYRWERVPTATAPTDLTIAYVAPDHWTLDPWPFTSDALRFARRGAPAARAVHRSSRDAGGTGRCAVGAVGERHHPSMIVRQIAPDHARGLS